MFNKEEYRKNREAGKRGQGEYPRFAGSPLLTGANGQAVSDKPVTKKALLKNTKRARALKRSN